MDALSIVVVVASAIVVEKGAEMPEVMPEVIPEVIPEVMPEVMPEATTSVQVVFP